MGHVPQHVHDHIGQQVRRVGGCVWPGEYQKQGLVPSDGLAHRAGQESRRNFYFGGYGLVGRQVQERLSGFEFASWRMLVLKTLWYGQSVVVHVQ